MNSNGSPFPESADGRWSFESELARESRDLAALGPVLRYLVASEDHTLLGEQAVARTRGLAESLAHELVCRLYDGELTPDPGPLAAALCENSALLGHCHALAIEGQIVGHLAERGIDPVLPPLVQARIGDSDAQAAELAMAVMASQARFVHRQHRMGITLAELPGDMVHLALEAARLTLGEAVEARLPALRATFDERGSRLALLAQLGLALGDDFLAGLDPTRAGFSLFATALSLVTGQPRDAVVLASADGQEARLALLLAIAGLEPLAREGVILCLHPDVAPDPEWFTIAAPDAADLLLHGGGG